MGKPTKKSNGQQQSEISNGVSRDTTATASGSAEMIAGNASNSLPDAVVSENETIVLESEDTDRSESDARMPPAHGSELQSSRSAPEFANRALPRPAVMPRSFDGSSDWVEYVEHFEQCSAINGWADVHKVKFLPICLKGAAQSFYACVAHSRKVVWHEVCEDFSRRFNPAMCVRQYKAQFKSRRRLAGEDLAQLADELRCLASRAYPLMPDTIREELVRDQLVECISRR